jgi:short-subunit dehydrogenase
LYNGTQREVLVVESMENQTDGGGGVARGRLVWLIGASSGIGAELAGQLLAAGYRVAASARRADRLGELAQAQRAASAAYGVFPVDVTDAQAVHSCVQAIEAGMGPIDIAIVNAGDYAPMPVAAFDIDLFRRLIEVNYLGAVNCLAALLPRLTARGNGQILLTASVAGYRGLPLAAPYSASKAAVINLAESLQPELRKLGVQLRIINPGFVDTPLTRKNRFPMPFLMTPAAAARRILEGLDSERFEIAFPRRFVWLMKLLRCLPYRVYFPLIGRITRT